MNTFRLTQNQIGKNLYLLPNANGCNIGLTPFPNTGESNYEDVDDPRHNPDDDITYVHNDTPAVLHDLYDVENHTTENGTINYTQVFARAKTHGDLPHKDTTFKILLDDSNCTDTQKSGSFDLLTTYSKYSKVWNTNPFTGGIFTWDNIDNYQIGVECSSPTLGGSLSVTLRPNAGGTFTQWTPHGAAQNWDCVNEAVANGLTDYVSTACCATRWDSHNIETSADLVGNVITGVTVFGVFKFDFLYSPGQCCRLRVKTGGGFHSSCGFTANGNNWTTNSYLWANNPNTGVAWTAADIDALEIGIQGICAIPGNLMCTQIYAVVTYYKVSANPDIRTTQCYMKVNYDEEAFCDLNMAEEISQDYVQNIKMLNHWSGNRSVYGLARSNDTTVLLGYEIEDSECTDACARLKCVEELAKQGDPVTLSGFSCADYNDEYQILSWGWKKISSKPVHCAWILELERTT